MLKLDKLGSPDILLSAGLLLTSVGSALYLGQFVSGFLGWVPAGLGALLVVVGAGMKLWKELQ